MSRLQAKLAAAKQRGPLSLDLSGQTITDEEAADVAALLRADKHIISLDLSHNKIGNEGAATIAEALTYNSTLTVLNLAHNNISDRGLTQLCEAAVAKLNLERIDIVGNTFGRAGTVSACLLVLARGPTAPKMGHGVLWTVAADAFDLPASFKPADAPGSKDEWLFYLLRSADKPTRMRILRTYEWKNQKLRRADEVDEEVRSRVATAAAAATTASAPGR